MPNALSHKCLVFLNLLFEIAFHGSLLAMDKAIVTSRCFYKSDGATRKTSLSIVFLSGQRLKAAQRPQHDLNLLFFTCEHCTCQYTFALLAGVLLQRQIAAAEGETISMEECITFDIAWSMNDLIRDIYL